MENKILNTNQIKKIVKRIAYQIHENNLECSEIVLIGVYKNGYVLAEIIEKELKQISKSNIEIIFIKINKENPLDKIELDCKKEYLKNKSIVLIDDVLHSPRGKHRTFRPQRHYVLAASRAPAGGVRHNEEHGEQRQ